MIFRLILDQLWGNLKVKKIFILSHRNHYKHMHRFFRRLTGAVWVYSGSQLYKVASRKASLGILSLLYVERGSFRKQKCRYWWDGFSMRVESNWKVADKNVYGREYAASETLLSVCLTSGRSLSHPSSLCFPAEAWVSGCCKGNSSVRIWLLSLLT